jgi:hypothetical protein
MIVLGYSGDCKYDALKLAMTDTFIQSCPTL